MNTDLLAVDVTGPEHAPALVFLHGFMGRKEDWAEIIAHLEEAFRCYTIDLPFHGASRSIHAEFDDTVHHIVRRLDGLGCRRFGLVGYSMGGRIALQLALHHAERVPRCVIESGSPGLMQDSARESRRQQDEGLAEQLDAVASEGGTLENFLQQWYRADLWASLRTKPERLEQLIATRSMHNDPAALASALRALGTGRQAHQWQALACSRTPILCVVGALDTKYRHIAMEMRAQAQALEIATVPACGHNVHFERPGEYVALLRNFFSQCQ